MSEGEIIVDLLEPDDVEYEQEIDYNIIIGVCANCSGAIHKGEGGTTVHDYCERAFIAYLNAGLREYDDD